MTVKCCRRNMGTDPSAAIPIPCPVCQGSLCCTVITSSLHREPLSASLLAPPLYEVLTQPSSTCFLENENEGKEAGFRDGCRQRDGKGNRGRDEASRCLKSSRIKLQTVQEIDKSFHVAVLSINFQLMCNHFSSGKNRNVVL